MTVCEECSANTGGSHALICAHCWRAGVARAKRDYLTTQRTNMQRIKESEALKIQRLEEAARAARAADNLRRTPATAAALAKALAELASAQRVSML